MLRNTMFTYVGAHPNVDVGVVINGVYVEIESQHFDPTRGVIVLDLDQEALAQAVESAARGGTE